MQRKTLTPDVEAFPEREGTVTLFRDFSEDQRTSMEVYADNLVRELKELQSHRFDVRQYRPALGLASRLPSIANIRMRAARYLGYPRQARMQQGDINHILDHGYAHLLKVLDPARTVVTVHDIIPILAGRGSIRGMSLSRRSWLAEYTARFYPRAARIITISENTKRDLVRHCGCDPERVEVVYYGIRPEFRPWSQEERLGARRAFGFDDAEKLVLITGQEYYKNQATSLAVMRELESRGVRLRLIRLGRLTEEWAEALRLARLQRDVIQIESVPAERMPELYNSVDCLLFPSWYEGFGLPPVEAMACGIPVVISNAASLPESGGPAALRAAPDDVSKFADHVASLLADPDLRVERTELGLQHAREFTWTKNACRVAEIYQELQG